MWSAGFPPYPSCLFPQIFEGAVMVAAHPPMAEGELEEEEDRTNADTGRDA